MDQGEPAPRMRLGRERQCHAMHPLSRFTVLTFSSVVRMWSINARQLQDKNNTDCMYGRAAPIFFEALQYIVSSV